MLRNWCFYPFNSRAYLLGSGIKHTWPVTNHILSGYIHVRIERSFTEDELFRGVRKQDRKVLLFLYRKYKPMVRWVVITNGGSRDDAKDIFQDSIIILLITVQKHGFKQRCKMKTLIFAIANVQWKYKSRRRRREIPFQLLEHDCIDEAPFPSADEIALYEKVIWSSFRELPETCQKVLLLHWDGFSKDEIAVKLECSEAYIRKRKSTCLQRFVSVIRRHQDFIMLSKTSQAINLEFKNHER